MAGSSRSLEAPVSESFPKRYVDSDVQLLRVYSGMANGHSPRPQIAEDIIRQVAHSRNKTNLLGSSDVLTVATGLA